MNKVDLIYYTDDDDHYFDAFEVVVNGKPVVQMTFEMAADDSLQGMYDVVLDVIKALPDVNLSELDKSVQECPFYENDEEEWD